ncbi:MAG: tetratricopeptide repeat protein, partial [Chitinispirillaceae bacterium]|nr:tetratricopeptide repeat protein [Chitinispirillaceae bacterium]
YGRTLAILYYYDQRFARAESLLKTLLESAFDDEELHYYLGLVFAATKRADDARLQLEKAVALNPAFAEPWRELCYLSIREGRYDDALAVAQRYVRKAPESTSSWRLKGYVLSMQKKYKQAIKTFTRALELDTADATTWFELGSSYERTGDISRAAAMFRKELSLRPDDPAASNYLGYMWAEKGMRLDSAEVLIRSALSKDPYNGAYLDSYAWIFFQKGSIEDAYAWIKESLARIANDPVVYEHLGDILQRKGDPLGARGAYHKSLEFNHDTPDSIRQKIIETFISAPSSGGKREQ